MAAFDRETVLIYEGTPGQGWTKTLTPTPIQTRGYGDLSLIVSIDQDDLANIPETLALLIVDVDLNPSWESDRCSYPTDMFFIPRGMWISMWCGMSDMRIVHEMKLRTIPENMVVMLAKGDQGLSSLVRVWAHVQYLTDDAIPIPAYVPPHT